MVRTGPGRVFVGLRSAGKPVGSGRDTAVRRKKPVPYTHESIFVRRRVAQDERAVFHTSHNLKLTIH